MVSGLMSLFTAGVVLFGALPTSSTYRLDSYGIGSGGTAGSDSSIYSLEGITGEASGTTLSSTTYDLNSGFNATQQADVPPAPTFVNSSNWYDKLHLTINPSTNPDDARFVVAISTDNFVTTNYVQSDNTVGASLGSEDQQTYTAWGGGSGVDVIGLTPSTTYKVKVNATKGDYTQSKYGPIATAATVSPTLTFDIDISSSNSETAAPYTMAFGSLLVGTVTDSTEKIWFDFETNANSGGSIYFYDQYTGLRSNRTSYTIASSSTDLATANEGYGAQSSSATQSSGGPIAAISPYNGASQNVGIIDTTVRQVYSTPAAIIGGRVSFLLKAKSGTLTPASPDYADTITAVAAATF